MKNNTYEIRCPNCGRKQEIKDIDALEECSYSSVLCGVNHEKHMECGCIIQIRKCDKKNNI